MGTCFVIMPFRDELQDIADIVQACAESAGLEYRRADKTHRPGVVMAQVVEEIENAEVVVADTSGYNANVFYELAIAHQVLTPERVVIITQNVDKDKAYDIHQFKQLLYRHTAEGREALRQALPQCIEEARRARKSSVRWNVIQGRVPRTKMIVKDLASLASSPNLAGTIIRTAASFTALAISELEPPDSELGAEYLSLLIEERDTLVEALCRGARLKAILHPPQALGAMTMSERVFARYERLVSLLSGQKCGALGGKISRKARKAMECCEFVFSPLAMPHQYILGTSVAYEGLKRGGMAGFEMTHCEVHPEPIHELIRQFDSHFASCARLAAADPSERHRWMATELRRIYDQWPKQPADSTA